MSPMNESMNVGDLPAGKQRPLHDFLLLQRVAQRIGSILDFDELLEQIVDDVAATFGYSRSGILLVDEKAGDLVIAAVRPSLRARAPRLFLYSDGVVEARSPSGEEYGESRPLRRVSGPSASAETLLQDVAAHAAGHPVMDDVTIVVIDALPPGLTS